MIDTNSIALLVNTAIAGHDAGGLMQIVQAGPMGLYLAGYWLWKKLAKMDRRLDRLEEHLGTKPPFKIAA